MAKRNDKNLIGATGEYYVCAELCRRGVVAVLTPKNNPLFDILAYNPNTDQTAAIQVKTMGEANKLGWKLNKGILERKEAKRLFVILVNLKDPPDFYVFEYNDLSLQVRAILVRYLNTPGRRGRRKDPPFCWIDLKDLCQMNPNNWELLRIF